MSEKRGELVRAAADSVIISLDATAPDVFQQLDLTLGEGALALADGMLRYAISMGLHGAEPGEDRQGVALTVVRTIVGFMVKHGDTYAAAMVADLNDGRQH